MPTVFTVGHSTHERGTFVELLRRRSIELLADVRRHPGSRRMPWFNGPELARWLAAEGIAYEHFEALGGRRSPRPDSPNGGWRVGQFQGYADHMESEEFQAALARLESLAAERRVAIMCAEAQWARCHRRLTSDALLARGHQVQHIDSRGGMRAHELTEFAVAEDGRLTYPPLQHRLEV